MRMEQLYYLIEISKNKSLNSASQKLHLTPQALSYSVKSMEDELQMQLLERSTQGVLLTPAGKKMVKLARTYFSGLEKIQLDYQPAHTSKELRGVMSLIMPHGVSESYLAPLLSCLYEEHPQAKVTCTELNYPDIITTVTSGQSEFALTYKTYINGEDIVGDIPPSLNFTPFFRCRYFCYVPKKFALSRQQTISLKSVLAVPFILYEPAEYILLRILQYAGASNQIIRTSNTIIQKELLNNGVGVSFGLFNTFLNRPLIEYGASVIMLPFKESIIGDFGYLTRRDRPLSEQVQTQLDFLTDYFSRNEG